MTAISRSYPTHEIDVRCAATLPQMSRDEGRCQLFAGHDGPHAVMFTHCGRRLVRTWRSSDPAHPADIGSGAMQRPWMYGYPVPAWFESDADRSR